jgi:hypothetical protein
MVSSLEHDTHYRRCLAHRVMLEHLLTGFVPDFDPRMFRLDTLHRVDPSSTPEGRTTRYGDRAWKVQLADRDAYMCIALEFQASADKFMVVRFNEYVGGLLSELCKGQEFSRAGKLP